MQAHWQFFDARYQGPTTHENFMIVLSNVQGILIRATHHTNLTEVVLSDIQMDIAVPQFSGQELANAVEACRCPPGYTGLSCEVLFVVISLFFQSSPLTLSRS